MARNATDGGCGYLDQRRYVLHDRDTRFSASFLTILAAGGIKGNCPACAQSQSEELVMRKTKKPMPAQFSLFPVPVPNRQVPRETAQRPKRAHVNSRRRPREVTSRWVQRLGVPDQEEGRNDDTLSK